MEWLVRLGWKEKGLRGTAQIEGLRMGEDGMGGRKRCYYEVLVKCFIGLGRNKWNRSFCWKKYPVYVKFVNPIDPFNRPFLTLPTCLPPLCCSCCSVGVEGGKFLN